MDRGGQECGFLPDVSGFAEHRSFVGPGTRPRIMRLFAFPAVFLAKFERPHETRILECKRNPRYFSKEFL
jgi:hypothetical protein